MSLIVAPGAVAETVERLRLIAPIVHDDLAAGLWSEHGRAEARGTDGWSVDYWGREAGDPWAEVRMTDDALVLGRWARDAAGGMVWCELWWPER